jgi:hypothetical protein
MSESSSQSSKSGNIQRSDSVLSSDARFRLRHVLWWSSTLQDWRRVRLVCGSQEGFAVLRVSLMLSGDMPAAFEARGVCLLGVFDGAQEGRIEVVVARDARRP